MNLDQLAEGVVGYSIEDGGATCFPVVDSTERGKGHVSRFLDGLPKDRTIKFPTVISPILRGMLTRRGFKIVKEWAEEFGEHAEVFVRDSQPKKEATCQKKKKG